MSRRRSPFAVVAAIASGLVLSAGGAWAAECNVHDAEASPAIGRAFRPGTTLYSAGAWPALKVKGVKLPAASGDKTSDRHKIVVNGGFEPDLRKTWIQRGPLRFENLAPLAGCSLKKRRRILNYNTPKATRVPELTLASWCHGDLARARVVTAEEAWTYSQTGRPYCVAINDTAFDPRGIAKLRVRPHERERPVAPWTSSKRLWLVANLPEAAERSLDVRVKLTLHHNDLPSCASCRPDEELDCETSSNFRVLERTVKLAMQGTREHAFEILELASLKPEQATHLELDARLFARGEELASHSRELRWPLCR